MDQKPKKQPGVLMAFRVIGSWAVEKWKTLTAIVTALTIAVGVALALWRPIGAKLTTLEQTAAATQSIRNEIDTRSEARDKQFNAIAKRLDEGATAQQATSTALAVTTAKLEGTNRHRCDSR